MNMGDVRGLTADQISDQLLELKREQFNLRFQAATGQLEKPHRVGQIRKDIARLKTRLTETAATGAATEKKEA